MLVAFSSYMRICSVDFFMNQLPPAYLKWSLVRAHKFHPSSRDQSAVAQRAKTTVAERFQTSFV